MLTCISERRNRRRRQPYLSRKIHQIPLSLKCTNLRSPTRDLVQCHLQVLSNNLSCTFSFWHQYGLRVENERLEEVLYVVLELLRVGRPQRLRIGRSSYHCTGLLPYNYNREAQWQLVSPVSKQDFMTILELRAWGIIGSNTR